MIKLVLLSGFLGSGKTTLMTNVLNSFADEKVGLIVNEFGKEGIDGSLLARDGMRMTELNNGSIFCACIKDSFLRSLIEMSKQDLSYLFIEPSGLADPSEMGSVLKTIAPHLEKEYDYRGVICVVDAENFAKLSRALPALPRQVEYCSVAIINKADLVSGEQLENISELIRDINPACEIIATSYCQVDARTLVEQIVPADKLAEDSTNTPETRLFSLVLKPRENVPVDALTRFVDKLMDSAYRVKGFLPTDSGIIAVNAVGGVNRIEPWTKENPPIGLVVISAVGMKIISIITDALKDGLGESLHL